MDEVLAENLRLDKLPATSWVGLDFGQYHIQKMLGEGSFSWVYEGHNTETNQLVAFKVAKPRAQVGKHTSGGTIVFPTRALIQVTGAYSDAAIDAADLMQQQVMTLKSAAHPNLLRVDAFTSNQLITFYQCEFVDGENLRSLMNNGSANISHLLAVAQTMADLQTQKQFVHCDLKPENVMFSSQGIKIIDPGFMGTLTADSQRRLYVTTPSYYPLLVPNDLLAFGIMSWEIMTGEHPLSAGFSSDMLAPDAPISAQLLQQVKRLEMGYNYFASPLLNLKRPSNIKANISTELDNLLLKLLGLRIDEKGLLASTDVFSGFSQIAQVLAKYI